MVCYRLKQNEVLAKDQKNREAGFLYDKEGPSLASTNNLISANYLNSRNSTKRLIRKHCFTSLFASRFDGSCW